MEQLKFGCRVWVQNKIGLGIITEIENWNGEARYFVLFEKDGSGWFAAADLKTATPAESLNLPQICLPAARKAVEAQGADNIIALNREDLGSNEIKGIYEKYAPDWQKIFGLNLNDMADDMMFTYLNYYFFLIVIMFASTVKEIKTLQEN